MGEGRHWAFDFGLKNYPRFEIRRPTPSYGVIFVQICTGYKFDSQKSGDGEKIK